MKASEIDWSKAPEGATHYGPENDERFHAWYKQLNGKWMCFLVYGSGKWVEALDCELKAPMIARPELPPTWNGTGLPPVGTVCEHEPMGVGGEWVTVQVLAHTKAYGGDVAVFQVGDDVSFSSANCFRPIRTPEQIAAEEREKAVREISGVLASYGPTFRVQAAAIYDAGYRKVE